MSCIWQGGPSVIQTTSPGAHNQQGTTMTSTTPLTSADLIPTSVAYVDCDIPDGQTLVEWRLERDAARRAERRVRRRRTRPAVGVPRLPRLRPAW